VFIHAFIAIPFCVVFSWRASSLARKKYPYVIAYTSYIGKGAGWDPYIESAAERYGDIATVNMLKFNRRSIGCLLVAMVSYVLSLIVPVMLRSYLASH